MSVTKEQLDNMIRCINKRTGLDFTLEYMCGRPRMTANHGSQDISPRLPKPQMRTYLSGLIEGLDIAQHPAQFAPTVSPPTPSAPPLRDYRPEVDDLLNRLQRADLAPMVACDGEDNLRFDPQTREAFVSFLTGVDAATFTVLTRDGRRLWLSLVYGNAPGELVNDHTQDSALSAVTIAHANAWDGKSQPMRAQ